MKALLLTGPRKLALESLPDPTPGTNEAVVQVSHAGICGTDVEIFINDLTYYKTGFAKLPIIPGHEWSGTVVAVGSGVTHLKSGDRVICEVAVGCGACRHCRSGHHNVCLNRREVGILNQHGGFAQLACVPAVNLRKCGDLSFEEAVLAEPSAVALNGCRQGQISVLERVLVVGAGPIGLLALQCARACGATRVCVLDRVAERLKLAKALGADDTLDGSAFPPEELPERARSVTQGEGFDVILECAAAGKLFPYLLSSLAQLGRLVIIGCFHAQRPAFNPDELIAGERKIVGSIGGGTSYDDAVALLRAGRIQTVPLVTHRLSLAEGPTVLAGMADRTSPPGTLKVLLKP